MEGIEIIDFQPEGYKPLVDYESWRVAVLKFCDDLLIENVKTMQKHLYTDEVFVLVQGHCTLFLAVRATSRARLQPYTWSRTRSTTSRRAHGITISWIQTAKS